jgi:hypothetical protein
LLSSPVSALTARLFSIRRPAPLHGLLATTKPVDGVAWLQSRRGLGHALQEFASRLSALPWLEVWPLMMDGVAIRTTGKGVLVLADELGQAVPLAHSQVEALALMIGLDGLSLLCIWDGRTAQVIAADTPIGVARRVTMNDPIQRDLHARIRRSLLLGLTRQPWRCRRRLAVCCPTGAIPRSPCSPSWRNANASQGRHF